MKGGNKLMDGIRQLLRDETGVTAIEYALIAGVICTAIVGAVTSIGGALNSVFTAVVNGFPK